MLLKKTVSRLAIVTLGAGLLASVSNLAIAADMSSPADGWTGPYVGLLAGVEPSNNTWHTTGLGLGNFVGVDATSATQKLDGLGGRFGIFAGWNFPVAPNIIAGVDGDFAGLADDHKGIVGIPGVDYNFPSMGITGVTSTDTTNITQKFDAGIRARVGYLVDPKWLVYGTGGVAFQKSEFNVSCPSSANTASLCGVPQNATITRTLTGWTIGAGVETKIADRWTGRLEYRYADFGSRNLNFFTGTNSGVDTVAARVKSESHIITLGVSYSLFGTKKVEEAATTSTPAPAPMPAPMAQQPSPPPAPQAQEKFLVFFDFDKSMLTDDAKKVVVQAADYAKSNGKVVISATGHTDTMGTAAYNMALSERRAKSVRDALVKLGIPAKEINIHWKGKSEPLIQTGDGVKEPQNRRVEIVLE